MLAALRILVGDLRTAGVPVSMVEVLDAAAALDHLDLADRDAVRSALAATLVKNARHRPAFDLAFDLHFARRPRPAAGDTAAGEAGDPAAERAEEAGADAGWLAEALSDAARRGDSAILRTLAAVAVEAYAGLRPGRPAGVGLYLHRVMSRLAAAGLLGRLDEAARAPDPGDPIHRRTAAADAAAALEEVRRRVTDEIIARMVDDRGAEAVAATLRRPLVDDLDLMHATRDELAEISRQIRPLARRLASRLSVRRTRGRRGRLDVKRTIRASLAHGGVPADPRWRPRRVGKPELVLLCDVSGSMATFARFTLQLTYALGNTFSNVRAFVFVDGVDEVTRFFGPGIDLGTALARIDAEAQVVAIDGHSDYGLALETFRHRFADAVTPRSTVIVTGDARSNYRDPGIDALADLAGRARTLHWLNPEPERHWDTGDSVMSRYAPLCDGVYEVRTLRQLEAFVERVAVAPVRPRRGRRPVRSVV